MKLKMLKAVLASLFLSLSSIANAGLITEELDVAIVSGVAVGATGSLSVEFDDDLLSGVGEETLEGTEFTMTLNLLGQIFTNTNDTDYPQYPWLIFSDGVITELDLIISEINRTNPTDINFPGVVSISGGDVRSSDERSVFLVTTTGVPVPEPSTLAIFVLGILGLMSRKLNQ
ncbi:PEP-CTERM sorting domain-containing protein [Thalassotalea agarivorans]|uniref:PEP-CTERM protein-sorting domain-containing protein n=1 Tax=Thalassotalea agarivorans TaxID=349064 RepID=A0A1I0FFM2_THASX|nr:PEP-CTERM sorting domain-containing protein [Thalassotalea agarivorans]SET57075.1 PEP-CTERM protein-sorting domain-containing protein [Thalassotalea agarivorans]